MKRKVIIAFLVISIIALSSSVTYSAFTKKFEFDVRITTADIGYCKNNQVGNFFECLISASQQKDYTTSMESITEIGANQTSSIEPQTVYQMRHALYNNTTDSDSGYLTSSSSLTFTYVEETKKIDVDEFNETGTLPTDNITFNTSTGYFTYTNSKTGTLEDILTDDEYSDKDTGNFIYTCFNTTSNGSCTTLYIIYKTRTHSTNGSTLIKKADRFYYLSVEPSTSNSGLFKVADEYTTDTDNDGELDSNFSYVYRGNVKNNWVEYAGSLWRIVRINGNGTVRMIYSGDASKTSSTYHTGSYASILMTTSSGGTTRTSSFAAVSEKLGRVNYNTATSVGYMYNPVYKLDSSPKTVLKSPENPDGKTLLYVGQNNNFGGTTKYYFFNEFDLNTNCSLETETCTFTAKCETDENGNEICNYTHSTWNDLVNAKDDDGNPINYTDDDNYGHYSNSSGSTQYYYYTNQYKYVCNSNIKTTTNEDGTITVNCPLVLEVLGAYQTNYVVSSTVARVKYHGIFSNSAEDAYSNVEDSKIKTELDTWYENNILNTEYENYLADEGFCGDRSYNESGSDGVTFDTRNSVIYGAYTRNVTNKSPSLLCPNESRDLYTTASSSKGNKSLTYPIGLITIDEAALAGGKNGSMNQNYYLYTGQTYWTMSPCYFYASYGSSYVWFVNSTGNLNAYYPSDAYGVRPVVNLRSDVLFVEGDGTESNPYKIELSVGEQN